MSVVANPVIAEVLQTRFLMVLPRVELHGRIYFRHLKCPAQKADAIQEMRALAWKWFLRLPQRGKDPAQFLFSFVTFLARSVNSGRRLTGMANSKDAMCPAAQKQKGFAVRSLPGPALDGAGILSDALCDNTVTPPADAACFRIDFPCWIRKQSRRDRGINASAFGIYQEAYLHRDKPIVLDDVDGLYRDRNGIRLLKTLCQTEPVKSVNWHTDAASLAKREIPRQFTTTSRVAFIANQWQSLNADVAALEDRGHFLVFEPTALEVHRHAATWFWDQQVFDFVGTSLHLTKQPSFRTYMLDWELKKAGLDWRTAILGRCLTGTALIVARLKADQAFASEEDRVNAFVATGAGCRATYFNHARKLTSAAPTPHISLVRTCPPPDATGDSNQSGVSAGTQRQNPSIFGLRRKC